MFHKSTLLCCQVEVKRAVPRGESRNTSAPRVIRTKKMFLGGMSPDTTKDDIINAVKDLFPEGTSFSCTLMTEKETNKPRGFGFLISEPPSGESDDVIYDVISRITEEKQFVKVLVRLIFF